jgi:hypothetical protein
VTAAEVVTIVQAVPGVIAVDLTRLYQVTVSRGERLLRSVSPILCASPARFQAGRIAPAELLLINPAGITLTQMQL